MHEENDFSNALPNPYVKAEEFKLRLSPHTAQYFQKIAEEWGLSAERVIYMYLRHIAYNGYKIEVDLPASEEPLYSPILNGADA